MTRDDCEAVGVLFAELDALHADRLPLLFRPVPQSYRGRTFFERILADEHQTVLLAEETRVLGFVHILLVETPDLPLFNPQLRGLVNAVFVARERRRAGLATALMQAAEAWAAKRGAARIELNTYAFNDEAERAFAAMGYLALSRKLWKPTRAGTP